jgi:hypothetical protein
MEIAQIVKAPVLPRRGPKGTISKAIAEAMLKVKVGEAVKVGGSRQWASQFVSASNLFLTERHFHVQGNGDAGCYIVRDR